MYELVRFRYSPEKNCYCFHMSDGDASVVIERSKYWVDRITARPTPHQETFGLNKLELALIKEMKGE